MTDLFRKPTDLPLEVPVFPLRGAILLPRATLPLNVFEPRYLELVNDCLRSGDRLFGVVQPARSTNDDESPEGSAVPLRRVGCVGRVTMFQEQDDGRYVITLTGIARFTLAAELPTKSPYRRFAVDYSRFSDDLTAGLGEDAIDRQHLLKVLRSYLDANRLSADWDAIKRSSSEFLINALSVMSPYGPEEKQALLEAVDLKARGDVLVALAEMDLASSGDSGSTLQ